MVLVTTTSMWMTARKEVCHFEPRRPAGCRINTFQGIKITSTPGAVNHATADIAIFLMIGALRQAHKPLAGIRAGKWRGDFTLGHDPNKKILGIIGMGGIGRVSTILL